MGQDLTMQNQSVVQSQIQWAKLAAGADILPDAYKGKPSDILIAEGFGASMGLSPAESLYRISVIKGKPTMSAELIASQVRRAGHKLLPKEEDLQRQSVTVTIIRADMPDYRFKATRDKAWAQNMGLLGKDNYKKQLMTMLYWRALAACAREACPEALYGAGYTPDEMRDVSEVEESRPEEPVDVHVVASPEQRRQLMGLLRAGGVDSTAKARVALKALIGVDSGDIKDVPDDDVLMMLDAPDLVPGRVKDALLNAEHPDIEPPHEAQEASEAKK